MLPSSTFYDLSMTLIVGGIQLKNKRLLLQLNVLIKRGGIRNPIQKKGINSQPPVLNYFEVFESFYHKSFMTGVIDRAVNAIIRPPRNTYKLDELPTTLVTDLTTDANSYVRHPFSIKLPRKETIVGSLYHLENQDEDKGGPCVIYMHGNSSSQLEGQFLVPNFCQYNVYVFCFDFVGCGCSSGDTISLGYFEQKDTEFIIQKLHSIYNLGPFVLWGRSMGAATALLVKNSLVVGIIADSPFSTLKDLCSNIAKTQGFPSLFVSTALWYLSKQVSEKAKFKLDDVNPIEAVKSKTIAPTLYGHSKEDDFIPFNQTEKLFKNHANKIKFLNVLSGGHNDKRPISWIRLAVSFALERFGIKVKELNITDCKSLQSQDAHCKNYDELLKKANEGDDAESIVEAYQNAGGNLFAVNITSTEKNVTCEEDDDNLEMLSVISPDEVRSDHASIVQTPKELLKPGDLISTPFATSVPHFSGTSQRGSIIGKKTNLRMTEQISEKTVKPRRLSNAGKHEVPDEHEVGPSIIVPEIESVDDLNQEAEDNSLVKEKRRQRKKMKRKKSATKKKEETPEEDTEQEASSQKSSQDSSSDVKPKKKKHRKSAEKKPKVELALSSITHFDRAIKPTRTFNLCSTVIASVPPESEQQENENAATAETLHKKQRRRKTISFLLESDPFPDSASSLIRLT